MQKFDSNPKGRDKFWRSVKRMRDEKYGAVPVVLARRAALPGQPSTFSKPQKTFHTKKFSTPLILKTYPFCSWNFLSSRTKFSCSCRYTAGSLFNIFAILRLCHFHITFTAFSGKIKAIRGSRGFRRPELHSMEQRTSCFAAWLSCGTGGGRALHLGPPAAA